MGTKQKYDADNPILSFRVKPSLKTIIIKYGERRGFIDKDTGFVIMQKTIYTIIKEALENEGIIETDIKSNI